MSPVVDLPTPEYSEETARVAFEEAIKAGRLSEDEKALNYAGWYMYMGHKAGKALFKHSQFRTYID